MQAQEIHIPAPKKSEYVSIFSVCCLHIGHKCHDKEKALSYRDYILNTPDCYAYDLGDDMENAVPGDEVHNSMMWDSDMHPQEQFDKALEYWEPVVKAGKLLMTHDSNHFWRSEAKTGISVAKNMNVFMRHTAEKAKVRAPEWGQWQAFTKLHVGKQMYRVHSWHGAGGSATAAGALNKCRSQAMIHQADVFLMGHYHRKVVDQDLYFAWPDGEAKPIEKMRAYGVTGSFMKWEGSYAERAGYGPSIRGAIKLELSAKRWDIKISL
jgi:hypothetical protein